MPDAPNPITAAPAASWQPYDATAPGAAEDQTAPETIYDSVPGDTMGGPWRKIQDGGAIDMTGKVTGEWPGDGTSDGSAWKQT